MAAHCDDAFGPHLLCGQHSEKANCAVTDDATVLPGFTSAASAENYAQQLHIEELAAQAQMSTSSFHSHFRSMTSLSPLQYQKRLRLQEARRLMLAQNLDATTAAFQVGYESSSQFSRE